MAGWMLQGTGGGGSKAMGGGDEDPNWEKQQENK